MHTKNNNNSNGGIGDVQLERHRVRESESEESIRMTALITYVFVRFNTCISSVWQLDMNFYIPLRFLALWLSETDSSDLCAFE